MGLELYQEDIAPNHEGEQNLPNGEIAPCMRTWPFFSRESYWAPQHGELG